MLIEERFISLELAKKLNELKISERSIFVWEWFSDESYGLKYMPHSVVPNKFNNIKIYNAYTSSELMCLLPHRITLKENKPFNSFTIYIKKSFIVKNAMDLLDKDQNPSPVFLDEINYKTIYIINYECDSASCTGEDAWFKRNLLEHNIWDENFSNALAKTLIYLMENKFI